MKIKITTAIVILFIFFTGKISAQEAKYTEAMQVGLKMFNGAKTSADYVAAANHFERVGKIAKTEWLPFYYAAYCQLINNTLLSDEDDKDAVLDKAIALEAKAEAINPKESEIFALKGYIKLMKIYVKPMTRMMTGAKSAMSDLETATKLNPDNPRPYFIIAQNTYYTPKIFGGGKEAAKPKLTAAAEKFKRFKPVNELMPNWGKERNAALLAQCK